MGVPERAISINDTPKRVRWNAQLSKNSRTPAQSPVQVLVRPNSGSRLRLPLREKSKRVKPTVGLTADIIPGRLTTRN